jgi:parallel beta-helix repeat protein
MGDDGMQGSFQARFALALVGMAWGAMAAKAQITLTPGVQITDRAVVKPGVYRLTDAGGGSVRISGRDFTVDFKGAKIVGPGTRQGVGIVVADARNVTIRNANVSGCLWGIVVERSVGVKLLDCVSSRNGDLPPGTVIDESGREPEDRWGGGILLRDSRRCRVRRGKAQYQWDGIDVVRSENCVIEEGDFSYNGNWGLHLWNSARNTFRSNRAVWCTTGGGRLFQALTGWQTYDSQAVGIDHNSCENLVEGNDLRFGGDGIFIRANEGPIAPGTVVPPRNGSHRNILRNNDCSFSPNNAIEVDLVDDTVIEGNNCSFSNYGMWLGYSRRCSVRNNLCVNDSTHAVEIENGQDDLFENNVFSFDTPRRNGALVYLRQNGRDKTPSGPYTFRNNFFAGAPTAILLRGTTAAVTGNCFFGPIFDAGKADAPRLVVADAVSKYTEASNRQDISHEPPRELLLFADKTLTPGALFTLSPTAPGIRAKTPVVELDGIPLWVRAATAQKIVVQVPADFWDRVTPREVLMRIYDERVVAIGHAVLAWPADRPRIDAIAPNPAKLGDTVTILGANLGGGRLLFNGKPAAVTEATPTKMIVSLPEGILTPTRYNVLWEKGEGENRLHTWPITFAVQVPDAQRPRLVSATFRPTTLEVGDLLTVTFTIRNNLPHAAPLLTAPKPPFTYEEWQAYWELGLPETPGTLHLRVTSDSPAGHESGSWPWLFGFEKASLAPGETATVTGAIRVQTPGEHEFRVGLVATGSRFLDDNAFRTRVTVLP